MLSVGVPKTGGVATGVPNVGGSCKPKSGGVGIDS